MFDPCNIDEMNLLKFCSALIFANFLVSCSSVNSNLRNPASEFSRPDSTLRWIPFGAENEESVPVVEYVCKNKQTQNNFFYLPKKQGLMSKDDPCFEILFEEYVELGKLPPKTKAFDDAAKDAVRKYLGEFIKSVSEAQKKAKEELIINSIQVPQK